MKLPPHVRWPLAIAGALALQVVGSFVAIYLATSDQSFAVEEDYYRKAVEWDKKRAQDRRNAELGWQLAFDVTPPDVSGEPARLLVELADSQGSPVDGAIITVETFHNAAAGNILRGQLEPRGDGQYHTSLPMRRSGVWEVRFTVSRGAERFTSVATRHLYLERRQEI